MSRYYFFASLLPPLTLGDKPDLPFSEFSSYSRQCLSQGDLDQLMVVNRYMDIQNLRAFWKQKPLDPHGNYNAKELEEALLIEEALPSYVIEFIHEYQTLEDKLSHFPLLVATFFQEECDKAGRFLKDYLLFERELRLVLLGFRAKIIGRNVVKELQYEDPSDVIVAQIIAQKDAPFYDPPQGFLDLAQVFNDKKEDPLELHKSICKFRLSRYESMMEYDVFALDHILCYMVQLIIVENWLTLSQEKGREIVDTIIKENT